jgi:hypothetical protein
VTPAREAVELAALVRESVAAGAVREVLHLRLASLGPALWRPHHRRLLRDMLDKALSAGRSRVFDLPNGDLIAIARAPAPDLALAESALRQGLDAAPDAVRRLRLPEEAPVLLAAAAEALGLEPATAPPAAPSQGIPLDSLGLATVERALAAADLDTVTVAQAVCRLEPDGGAPEPAWEDRRIDWPALSATLLPGRDLAAAPALMRRLMRAAEARLLTGLAREAGQLAWHPLALTLSPATIEGPAFTRFAEALPAGRCGEVMVGFRAADLLADPAALARIAPQLHARGMRVALDDASPSLLALLPPARLPLDIVRLHWSPALPAAVPEALARFLAATPHRAVLTGVDRPAAIGWGWEAGIRLFQGPLVERYRGGL